MTQHKKDDNKTDDPKTEVEKEPPSLGELAADAEMMTGCAPEDAVQVAIEHLLDSAEK